MGGWVEERLFYVLERIEEKEAVGMSSAGLGGRVGGWVGGTYLYDGRKEGGGPRL